MDLLNKIYDKLISITDIFNPDIIVYYFSIAGISLILEMLVVGWEKSSIKKLFRFENTVKTDAFFFFLDAFNLYNLVTIFLSFGIFHILARLIYEHTNYDLILNIENYYLQFALLFVIGDFKNYVSHYLFHKFDTLWKLHEFHHSATDFCMLTRYRGHFLETAMKRFIDVIPFAIFGASVETYLIIKILSEVHQLVLHSSINAKWGLIGKYILVSPAAHKLHHSNKRKHYGRNFGSTFIFWDRMFGTYHPYDKVDELGVPANPYNKEGVLKDIYIGILNFLRSLKADIKKMTS